MEQTVWSIRHPRGHRLLRDVQRGSTFVGTGRYQCGHFPNRGVQMFGTLHMFGTKSTPVVVLAATLPALSVSPTAQAAQKTATPAPLLQKIHHYVGRQHHWAYWSYGKRLRYGYYAERSHSTAFRAWVLSVWKARAARAYQHYIAISTLTSNFACIHRGEGAWNAVNPAGPYYGGFQADTSFQRSYNLRALAAYGTANHWSVRAQVVMARRGYEARGYSPWPVTAPACGL